MPATARNTPRATRPLLAAAVACACTGAPAAHADEAIAVGHLACGGATLTARTQFHEVADHDRQVVSQTITIVPAGTKTASPLKLDAHPLRQPFLRDTPVLDASATGWACVTSTDGKPYVDMVMTCTESPRRPACVGTLREWTRLYDTRGRALDAGLPHDGPRESALLKRLKLEHLDDGVSMKDPTE